MAVTFEPSDRMEFVLSDKSRNLHPVRVIFDGSRANTMRVSLEYFQDLWSVDFDDVEDLEPFHLIYRIELLDLFDLFSINSVVDEFRQKDLLGCLCLLKEFAEIRINETDRPGWREMTEQNPEDSGAYIVGGFSEGSIDRVDLADFDAEKGEWLSVGDSITHWLDQRGERLHSLPLPVLRDAEPTD